MFIGNGLAIIANKQIGFCSIERVFLCQEEFIKEQKDTKKF